MFNIPKMGQLPTPACGPLPLPAVAVLPTSSSPTGSAAPVAWQTRPAGHPDRGMSWEVVVCRGSTWGKNQVRCGFKGDFTMKNGKDVGT